MTQLESAMMKLYKRVENDKFVDDFDLILYTIVKDLCNMTRYHNDLEIRLENYVAHFNKQTNMLQDFMDQYKADLMKTNDNMKRIYELSVKLNDGLFKEDSR